MLLDERVRRAQAGDDSQVLGLLSDFGWRERGRWHGLLGKYEQLLWHGKANLRNKDLRRFLQLYQQDASARKKLTWRYQDYATAAYAQDTATYLQDHVQTHFTRPELRQELVVQFLDCLQRYKEKPGVDFAGYLANYYRYRVFHLLQHSAFRTDLLNREDLLRPDDFEGELAIDLQEGWFNRLLGLELLREELGIFWTNGHCGPLFADLTTFERVLLRDHYLLKQTDATLAEKYGYHRNTIFNKRHAAIAKLKTKREDS